MPKRDDSFVEFIQEQLSDIDALAARRMFGGYGLYCGAKFFGIISDGRLYFKTDSASAEIYRKHGSAPFQPSAKQTLKNYYEVPADVIDNREELCGWARRAISIKTGESAKRSGRSRRAR